MSKLNRYRDYATGVVLHDDATYFMHSWKGGKATLQIHDIPYDISVKDADIKFKSRSDMLRDFGTWDDTVDLNLFASGCSEIGADDANVIVFFNNWFEHSTLIKYLSEYFDGVYTLIWHKNNPRPQVRKRHFTMAHEMIIWAYRGKYPMNFTNHNDMLSVIKCPVAAGHNRLHDEDGKILHSAQKPLKLVRYFVDKLSNEGNLVVDAYAGCLTTAVAATQAKRLFVVNEISEKYIGPGVKWLEQAMRAETVGDILEQAGRDTALPEHA